MLVRSTSPFLNSLPYIIPRSCLPCPFITPTFANFLIQNRLVSASICLSESFESNSNMSSAHHSQRSRPMECRPTQPSESCSFLQLITHAEKRLSIAPSRSSEPGTEASPISSNLELTNNFHTPTSFLRLTPEGQSIIILSRLTRPPFHSPLHIQIRTFPTSPKPTR
jgi:hypothetical protein